MSSSYVMVALDRVTKLEENKAVMALLEYLILDGYHIKDAEEIRRHQEKLYFK